MSGRDTAPDARCRAEGGCLNRSKISYEGPAIDDREVLADLPLALQELLMEVNGYIQFGGGFHLRGACLAPKWHSLRTAMEGEYAFHKLYPDAIDVTDIVFAEDCSGDQYLIRGGEVHQLASEVGEVDPLDMDLGQFLDAIEQDPVETLCMHPLLQYQKDGGRMQPGQLLLAYPPFCTGHSGASASLKAVGAFEVIGFHADLARQIEDLEDGDPFQISFTED